MSTGDDIMADDTNIATFSKDTQIIANQVDRFIQAMYPGYLINSNNISSFIENNSVVSLDAMSFYRIASCTIDKTDDVFRSINEKTEKLMAALHSVNIPIGFGVVSSGGVTNLVLCISQKGNSRTVTKIVNGLLSGIEIQEFTPGFAKKVKKPQSYGLLSGVPSAVVNDEKQTFSLSTVMRALNGSDYTVLFLAKPVADNVIQDQINELISIRDAAFTVSKRNISNSRSEANGESGGRNFADTIGHSNTIGGGIGGGIFKPFILSASINYSHSISKSHTEGYSESITKTITDGKTISAEIQNGFALELISYVDKAIERLKGCQNNGVWEAAICYSADTEFSRDIIKACLSSELSKPVPDKLPMIAFDWEARQYGDQQLIMPDFSRKYGRSPYNPLCSLVNSTELGLLCTFPVDSVPDFEMRQAKQLPLIRYDGSDIKSIGAVCDGERKLDNMPFSFSSEDLNKHTFVCGITGSGKTTTVKKILSVANKPFLVIEPAKREYRNLALKKTIYTFGKPELNCPQINPFYIMLGVSPQAHIDFLKDLFIASFSFYGPMPYILEKCLHNVYKNKGWDLTLGFHPLLADAKHIDKLFNKDYIISQYSKRAHAYLFPTMQDLKDEIERYVSEEMKYDGEVSGNIKTAIKVRLENLCVGTKGYMFNTNECIDMEKIMNSNCVFELEGLADDSDKAFCVGLMLVLISEYRQTQGAGKNKLNHLLVIEEAHRLLKNVSTEQVSEDIGNPKGKAVDHFTNIIAEMRSYGQGVIVAEQIPNKLAPDVIKNTSNKIVHRIVSLDDQQITANTIGLSSEDAIRLGNMRKGYALCHKEGMTLPVSVCIDPVADVTETDDIIFIKGIKERMPKIWLSRVNEILGNRHEAKEIALRLLNTVLAENAEMLVSSVKIATRELRSLLRQNSSSTLFTDALIDCLPAFLSHIIIKYLLCGVYAVKRLPDDKFCDLLKKFIDTEEKKYAAEVKACLSELYGCDTVKFAYNAIAGQILIQNCGNFDVEKSIKSYFIDISSPTFQNIYNLIQRRR